MTGGGEVRVPSAKYFEIDSHDSVLRRTYPNGSPPPPRKVKRELLTYFV